MPDAAVFDDVAFLGLARRSKRDPYRLGLFAQHLEAEERPLALLAIRGGTLVVTSRRILEFQAHLDVHGSWNVKEFLGYEVRRTWERSGVRDVRHTVAPSADGTAGVEDGIEIEGSDATDTVTVSRGPEPTLPGPEFELLRDAILCQAK